jgi:hypothetical protein
MLQEATPQQVGEMAAYVQSMLDNVEIFSYGAEPEMQVDFHIPCTNTDPLVADTLAAMVPCLSRAHSASAFRAGDYVQVSLHKEPSPELAEAFFQEALARIATDTQAAQKVAAQIAINRAEEIARVKARMQRLEALKKKAQHA